MVEAEGQTPYLRSLMMVAGGIVGGILLGSCDIILSSNAYSPLPWFSLTVYTVGIVLISYYLGGIFNSKLITNEEFRQNPILRLKSQVSLFPIYELIRSGTKAQRRRLRKMSRIQNSVPPQLMESRDGLIEAILDGYILPWYTNISDEPLFPSEFRLLLQYGFERLREKMRKVDRKVLMLDVIHVVHSHWTEYCIAIDKIKSPNELLASKFKFSHAFIRSRDLLQREYESLLGVFLPELLPPDLQSPLLTKFLSGILVKGLFFFYAERITEPMWINTILVSLVSAGSYVNGSETEYNANESNVSTPPPSPSLPSKLEGWNLNPLAKETLEDAPTTRTIPQFLRLDSNKREAKLGHGSSPVLTSIQTALSGLLSATALPLLPQGVSFDHTGTQQEPLLNIPIKAERSEGENGNEWTGSQILKQSRTPQSLSPSTRHKSWEESLGSKKKSVTSPLSNGTKSLDDSVGTQFQGRQDEFQGSKVSSPTYEEAEDFATTIAKLRCLLEQRESQTNVMQGIEPKETKPPPSQPLKAETKVRPSLDSHSSGSSLSSDGSVGSTFGIGNILEGESKLDKIDGEKEEETDPVISRFFLDISIPKTESCGDSRDQFTLYCIQYTGVYLEDDTSTDEGMPKLVLRTTTVKRSFQEFLLLQSQLEESPLWRPHLSGIKMPNAWLSLSFSNAPSNQRRLLLERYLQQVSAHAVLGFCPELRHFMAYGEDGFQMFGLSPFNNKQKRFGNLGKTFTGVFNSLRDALPSLQSDLVGNGTEGETGSKPSKKLFPSFLNFREKVDNEELKPMEDGNIDTREESGDEGTTDSGGKRSGCDSDESGDEFHFERSSPRPESALDSVYPLASCLTRFLCDVLWLPHQRPHSASVSAVMSVSGRSLENYLEESLDILLSEEAFVGYMDWFIGGETEKDEIKYSVDDLKKCLKQRVPIWVRWMWGRSRLDRTIDRLAEFFQIQSLNHDLILSLVQILLAHLMNRDSD